MPTQSTTFGLVLNKSILSCRPRVGHTAGQRTVSRALRARTTVVLGLGRYTVETSLRLIIKLACTAVSRLLVSMPKSCLRNGNFKSVHVKESNVREDG